MSHKQLDLLRMRYKQQALLCMRFTSDAALCAGSLDSMERGTVEWNSGTVEWGNDWLTTLYH